jgi:alpha-L-fucosidase 2
MLMQSANGELHLLPALPDVWQNGSVSGLRAIGGFQIVSMTWKDGKLVKAIIKSTLGGNLRLRVPNEMKLSTGGALKKANGSNTNQFYQVEETPAPIVSDKANIAPLQLKETAVYDLPTQAGKTYTFTAQ